MKKRVAVSSKGLVVAGALTGMTQPLCPTSNESSHVLDSRMATDSRQQTGGGGGAAQTKPCSRKEEWGGGGYALSALRAKR